MPSVKWNLWRHKDTGNFSYEINGNIPEKFEPLPTSYTFDTALKYHGYYKGSSACGTRWVDVTTGMCYSMGMADTDEMLKKCDIIDGMVVGTWGFVKRGTTLGIRYKGKSSNDNND